MWITAPLSVNPANTPRAREYVSTCARIFQSVAAGPLGQASFRGGAGTAALGLLLHYLIAISMSLVYYLVARRWAAVWEKPFLSGEANMSHTFANLEHHHFKYRLFRQPGDVHIHMFGTATLSFADGDGTSDSHPVPPPTRSPALLTSAIRTSNR